MSDDLIKNMSALLNLRSHPRGVDVENRIRAIDALLSEKEVYESFRYIRHQLHCPKCKSENIDVRPAPKKLAGSEKGFYKCDDCGYEFDDLTGTGFEGITYHELRNFVIAWYFSAFCPIAMIAEFCGMTFEEVAEMLHHAKELEKKLARERASYSEYHKKKKHKAHKTKEKDHLEFRKRQIKRMVYGLGPKKIK